MSRRGSADLVLDSTCIQNRCHQVRSNYISLTLHEKMYRTCKSARASTARHSNPKKFHKLKGTSWNFPTGDPPSKQKTSFCAKPEAQAEAFSCVSSWWNPDFANMSDAHATFDWGGPQNETKRYLGVSKNRGTPKS